MNIIKTRIVGALTLLALGAALTGCGKYSNQRDIVAEGIIYSVEYRMEDGQTGGFTRSNCSGAVPGGNGGWNVDAYGELTPDFLIITRPQQKDLGPRIIPTDRLLDIQFGTGGIKTVDENNPAKPQ